MSVFANPGSSTNVSALNIVCENFTVPAGGTLATGVPMDKFIKASIKTMTAGGEVDAVGTVDPDNTSSGDAAIIDGNPNTLTYNNLSPGSTNKTLPGIDLGAPYIIDDIKPSWWNPNLYGFDPLQVEASNDATNWDIIVTNFFPTGTTTASSDVIDVSGSPAYRYWRLRCLTGENASWVTMSELEAFRDGVDQEILWTDTTDFTILGVSDITEITNNTASDIEVRVCYEAVQ